MASAPQLRNPDSVRSLASESWQRLLLSFGTCAAGELAYETIYVGDVLSFKKHTNRKTRLDLTSLGKRGWRTVPVGLRKRNIRRGGSLNGDDKLAWPDLAELERRTR